MNNRPTHGTPLTEAEKTFPRGAEAGVKAWQGGPRTVRNRRAGMYRARTGNSSGDQKKHGAGFKKGTNKPATGTPRLAKVPGWANKYAAD